MLENIFKTYNSSFVFVLPLFKDILSNVRSIKKQKFNIHGLFCDYGLINTYLLNSKGEYDGKLRLLFNANKLVNANLENKLDSLSYNLLDVILNSQFFENILRFEDKVIIELKINKEWEEDVKKIMESSYSLVSKKYKDYILNDGKYLLSSDKNINYLYIDNIPAQIVNKTEMMREEIIKTFNLEGNNQDIKEYFNQFLIEKETLQYGKCV